MASAGIVDAQSVKGADTVGAHSRGYDAGKKVNGRKRHIVVGTLGLLIVVLVTAASLQDRDGGRRILDRARMAMPSIALVWADGGYAGKLVTWVARYCRIVLEIVRKPEGQRTFEVLPRRWVVERTLSWLVRWRRLDRDYERLPTHSEAMVKWAMIGLMARRLAPPPGRRPWQPAMPRKALSKHVLSEAKCHCRVRAQMVGSSVFRGCNEPRCLAPRQKRGAVGCVSRARGSGRVLFFAPQGVLLRRCDRGRPARPARR